MSQHGSQSVIQHREDETKSPGRAISFVFPGILFLAGLALFTISFFFPMFLFLLGIALFTVAFNYEDWGPWLFIAGIVSIGFAFAIPTTILPALEDRE